MHISCGCVLLAFHMCDKHGFTTKLELTKADLDFERLPCRFLHHGSLSNVHSYIIAFFTIGRQDFCSSSGHF